MLARVDNRGTTHGNTHFIYYYYYFRGAIVETLDVTQHSHQAIYRLLLRFLNLPFGLFVSETDMEVVMLSKSDAA